MSARPRVLCLDSDGVAELLRATGEVDTVTRRAVSDGQVEEELSTGGFQGLVVRSANTVTARTLEAARTLRVVGRAGIGLDNIDLEAAASRGVAVLNTPTASVGSVAELAIMLTLAALRRLPEARDSLLAGRWDRARLEGSSANGKRLAILGFGAIGERTAELGAALGMRVCTLETTSRREAASARGVELLPMDELLSTADVLSLHMPVSGGSDARPVIGAEELKGMKQSAVLINTARGALVDEDALLAALERGELGAAGLDVFSREGAPLSPTVSRLVSSPRVVAMPHLGGSTVEAREAISTEMAARLHEFLCAQPPS
jgi:D-3-phosphoglycerate dehydrogenase